jgi:hypothetical protein
VRSLINSIYETGQWPSVKVILFKKNPKLQNAATIAHTAEKVARIFRGKDFQGTEDIRGKDKFIYRRNGC